MKNIDVIRAFLARVPAKTANLRSTGSTLVNYNTTLAYWSDSGELILNTSYYSRTTSRIQSQLKSELGKQTRFQATLAKEV